MSVIPNLKKEYISKRNSVRYSMINLKGITINHSNQSKEIKYQSGNLSDRKRKKSNKEVKDTEPKKVDEIEIQKIVNQLINRYKNNYELCINTLLKFPSHRNKEIVNLIKPYLKELIGLMDIVSKEKSKESSDKTLDQIAMNLQYTKINKNKFICKYGEKGYHFYIILKGRVVFLVPKITKCYLNESEYLHHLIKLKSNGENELLRNIMIINRQYYDLGDDFDILIRELIEDYNSNNKRHSIYITPEIYNILKKLIEEEDNKISNDDESKENKEKINIKEYIERSKIDDENLNSKDRKKLSILMYQITNYYEDGQIFGTVALESKYGKRSATAISLEECELGLLTKEQYNSSLESIHQKSLEILFNLINSYNILGLAPKKAFDNRFCHMFKCVRFRRGAKLMEDKKLLTSVIVFNSGKFVISVNKNIIELNELIVKLYKIRGKMMGLSENAIKKELANMNDNKEIIIDQKFILPETMKMYEKKHNLIISMVNDKLVIGLKDTVDQDTHLPLFNCTCISESCDGYEITNNSLSLVNKEYPCDNNTSQISLINIEYYLKRLQLHMKEIESKIIEYNKNLKYDIKMNKKINNSNDKEDLKTLNENNNNNKEENDFDIRRNTFEIKKKNNNKRSFVQILGNSLKKDYSIIIKQRYNTVDKKNNDSTENLNNDSKRYENIKTMNEETINDNKDNNYPFIYKVKKSIKHKEHLLTLARDKSQKYLEIKKAEIRSLNMARNIKFQKDKYVDISSIFSKKLPSSKGKRNYIGLMNSAKREDLVLDNILNNINKKSKYDRILSSYISNNRYDDTMKENEEKNVEIKKEEKENKEIIKEDKKEDCEIKKIPKNNSITEDQQIYNKLQISDDLNNKGIVYPKIKSNLYNLIYNNNDSNQKLKARNNIITLDGINSLGNQDLSKSKSKRKKYKRFDKIMSNNKRKSKNLLQINKFNSKSIGVINNINEKFETNNNLPNIISVYRKEKVHFVDPLVLEKFNNHYLNLHKIISKNSLK